MDHVELLRRKGEAILPGGIHRRGLRLVSLTYGRRGTGQRDLFDQALECLHYAGKCQRVGRCMRLAIMDRGVWLGGIVLGSTFPNVAARDEALGLKRYVRNTRARDLRSPWASENREYWDRLQRIVNHARTFIFPEFQGQGIGIASHQLLVAEGVDLWRERYAGRVIALDTLCDSTDSGLFRKNGWQHVGSTTGYTSDRSRSLVDDDERRLRNNVALRRTGHTWEVWVKKL